MPYQRSKVRRDTADLSQQDRLTVLDRLKSSGTITEDECRLHRKRILETGNGSIAASEALPQSEVEQLRADLEREQSRITHLLAQRDEEQRRLRSKLTRLEERKEKEATGEAVRAMFGLTFFAFALWWLFTSDSASELWRYFVWRGFFGR